MNKPKQEELRKKIANTLIFHTGWDDLSLESPEVRDWEHLINSQILKVIDEIKGKIESLQTYRMYDGANDIIITKEESLSAIEAIEKEYK